MSFWRAENLRQITGGRWLRRPTHEAAAGAGGGELRGLSTDTRSLTPGQVFLALRGEQFDGHRFVEAAGEAGAAMIIIDHADAAEQVTAAECGILLVPDTLKALARLARDYRRRLSGRVIAVTGSAGKTTTKHLIDGVLGQHYRGSASPRSFNNRIGVPLTLLAADPADTYIVAEVGTNAPGEIAELGSIIEPDIAVITHIGAAHLEGLGGIDGVLREKASLLHHLKPGGVAIVNGDAAGLTDYRRVVASMVSFGEASRCDLRLTDFRAEAAASVFQVNNRWPFRLPMLGRHNALNALAAIAVARHMNLDERRIASALAAVEPAAMRLETRHIGSADAGVTLINDAYNANPDSLAAAVRVLADYPATGRRVAVLGDMLELGEQAAARHREAGRQVVEAGLDLAVFAGRLMMFAAETAARHWSAHRLLAVPEWGEAEAIERVAALIEPGDTLLLKGSRGMRMERLIEAIERRLTADCRTAGTGR